MCGREVIVPKSADPGPKSADPGPGTAAGRENPQTKSASVGAVGAVGAVVGVATRESRLCRQTHLTDSDRFNEILENLQILK